MEFTKLVNHAAEMPGETFHPKRGMPQAIQRYTAQQVWGKPLR